MALHGSLASMPLTDLLQWLSTARKSGTLSVTRNRVAKRIILREGLVIACSSDDPPELLGHFLVSHGKITEDTLRLALSRQRESREHLGKILVDMKAITGDDLIRHLAAKAEETIFSLFDWEEAEFRFDENEAPDPNIFPVSLKVEEILLRGLKRFDEMKRIRSVFNDPGIVLRRVPDRRPPPEVFQNRMARRIYEAINGERTVAGILLHAHGSEFLVKRFLFELFRTGFLEIEEVRPLAGDTPNAVAGETGARGTAPEEPAPPAEGSSGAASAGAAASVAVAPAPSPARSAAEGKMEAASALMARGDFDGALDLLNAQSRERPQDEALRKLVAEAEAAFVEKAYRYYLPAEKVLVLQRAAESLTSEDLSPVEFFLLSRVDGTWDVKSIIQITPIREVDALRTLKRMREKGIIALRDPA